MSLGMSSAWRAMQPKQKKCVRCALYYPEAEDKCIHCADLNDKQLIQLKAKRQQTMHHNAKLGYQLLAVSAVIAVLLFLSFL